MDPSRRGLLWGTLSGALLTVIGKISQAQTGRRAPSGDWLETLPQGQYPAYLKNASLKAREMYRFAVANGETLQYIPCYCGCGNPRIGHKSNADCYVAERIPDGRITFTSHAAG